MGKWTKLLKMRQDGVISEEQFQAVIDRKKQECPRRSESLLKTSIVYAKARGVSLMGGVKLPKTEPVIDYRYKD